MTDEEIDQVVEATAPAPGLTRRWRKFATLFARTRMGTWAAGKTPRWQTILALLVLASGFPLVIGSIGATDRKVTTNAIYTTQLITYSNAQNTYAFCLDVVQSQLAGRERWVNLIDFIQGKFGPDATEFVDGLRTTLLSDDPPTTDTCKSPGPAPVPPAN